MNILVLSWRDPKHPLSGGAEQVMHQHMIGWHKAGHKVTLFSSYYQGGLREDNLDGITIIRKGRQLLGVHIEACMWYLFKQTTKFDVVVDQFHGIPFFTPLYMRTKKVAVVQEVAHNVWLRNQLPKPFNWILGVIGLITEPVYYLFYKNVRFMTGSESAKKDLRAIGIPEKNITIIPHGAMLTVPHKLPPKESIPTVIFLGAIAKDKGIEDALKAFSILKEHGILQFWVVGKAGESYMREVQSLTTRLGLSDNVTFFGYVSEKKKFELLARSHIMVNPSVHEGWGLVNIESNSVETPVVAYPSAGLIDSIKNNINGMISKYKTPQSLAQTVLLLLQSEEKLHKLSKSAKEYSTQFSWDKSQKLSLNLIEKIYN